jgi:hypothetical protein
MSGIYPLIVVGADVSDETDKPIEKPFCVDVIQTTKCFLFKPGFAKLQCPQSIDLRRVSTVE